MKKIALITDAVLGIGSEYFARHAFRQAVTEQGLTEVSQVSDADTVILLGQQLPDGISLDGKSVWQGTLQALLKDPLHFIRQALAEAAPWVAAANMAMPALNPVIAAEGIKRIVAVTACPTGVAHTFMAAEAIEAEAKKRGWPVRVETRGSVGAANPITPEEVAAADIVFIAADIEVDVSKFAGKPIYRTSTGLALKKTAQQFDKALAEAKTESLSGPAASATDVPLVKNRSEKSGAYRHLLTGVSFMLPMVVAGGLCIALSFTFGITAFKEPGTLAAALMQIGGDTALKLMVPVLAGYIAFSIADRPGLTPGFIGGMLASGANAGFLGGIIAGFIAGYAAKLISRKLKLPQSMDALKPILIIPLFASLITGLMMIYIVAKPVAAVMEWLTHWLGNMGTTNAILLGGVLGAMQCSDLGGPINKVAYAFGVGLLSSKTYGPMAAIMAAGMVPPLAMGLATLLARSKFAKQQQQGGKAALVLGLCYITEGAIPFAARDPLRVIPCCIAGGALTGAISMAAGAKLMAPHGGLFVLLIPGAITPVWHYLLAILAGTALAGIAYALLKRPESETTA